MPLARSARSTLKSHASRLLTTHPRLLAALLALVVLVALQGSAAAAGEVASGGFEVVDAFEEVVDPLGDISVGTDEDATGNPGP